MLHGLSSEERFSIAIGYLRALVTVMVVAHHAVLAYHPFAPAPSASFVAEPRWWPVFPVIDAQRWMGFTFLVAFDDIFFMSLMFFLSGLFVWTSIARKGSLAFLRDRGIRLGLPFLVAAGVFAPLAYYPSYLMTTSNPGVGDFWRQWLTLGFWPSGPAWFICVLLAFDAFAVLLFTLNRQWVTPIAEAVKRMRPSTAFASVVVASAVAYVPLSLFVSPLAWATWGPFAVQTSRALHYLVYFVIGMAVGASGAARGVLAPDGLLSRRWLLWAGGALLFFLLCFAITILAFAQPQRPIVWGTLGGLSFSLSCAASSFAALAILLRWARRRSAPLDSLRQNAYGIYLVHYFVVSWLQFALLGAAWPALVKGGVVFLGAMTMSWGLTAALRRVPGVAGVI